MHHVIFPLPARFRPLALLLAVTIVAGAPATAAQGVATDTPSAPAAATLPTVANQTFRSEPAFVAEVTAARVPGTALPEQIAHWQRASSLAGGQCAECLERLATLNFRAAAWEAAIRAARDFAAISPKPADQGVR